MPAPVIVRSFQELQEYDSIWQAMRTFTEQRAVDTPDEIWLFEHQPVYTLGQAGKKEHLLNTSDIPVIKSDRGGQITYHGPGQLIAYLLLDLKRFRIGVRELVEQIESSVIALLKHFSIDAYGRREAPGVYIQDQNLEKKIAALGLRVRKGYSYHGLSFNRDMDLNPFQSINPCGFPGMHVTQLADLTNADYSRSRIEQLLIKELCQHLQIQNSREQIQ